MPTVTPTITPHRTVPRVLTVKDAHPALDNQIRLVSDGVAWCGTLLVMARAMVNDILSDDLPIALTLVQELEQDGLALVTTGVCTRWADNVVTFEDGVTIQVDESLLSVTI